MKGAIMLEAYHTGRRRSVGNGIRTLITAALMSACPSAQLNDNW